MIYIFGFIGFFILIVIATLLFCSVRRNNRDAQTIRDLRIRLSKAEDACKDINHNLNLAVLNEISRIEQNLRSMDFTTKGVTNLSNRVLAMKAIYSSIGYELPELIGKPYENSENHRITMKFDDSLDPGKAIVTKIIRPAILFNGVMIQSANIIVSYNEDKQDNLRN